MILNFNKGASPLYAQIKKFLLEKIENEEYQPGEIIPSELVLQKQFNVSRITIRQAINELAGEGYLSRQRGKGTIVTTSKIEENLSKVKSFTNEMKERGLTPSTHSVKIDVLKANKKVAKALEIEVGDEVYELVRVRCVNNEPLVVFVTYLRRELDLSLNPEDYKGSLYELLNNKKIVVSKVKEYIEATVADSFLSIDLDIQVGAPVLKRIRFSLNQDSDALEYTESFYRADKYRYMVELI
jgi:GntR family transcriptional regulator